MRRKILVITAAMMSVIGVASAAASYRFWVFGAGSAQDADRQSASSQAYDSAVDQVNAACAGVVVNVERTSAACFGGDGDSPYTCMVTAKGLCQIH
jgi:hypothetical protein